MLTKVSKKREEGHFAEESGSDVWSIRYYIDGRERREKVGRRSDALTLYRLRKADAVRGVKLPTLSKRRDDAHT